MANSIFQRVRTAMKKAEVDPDVLGNIEAAKLASTKTFANKAESMTFYASEEYRNLTHSKGKRTEELKKLVPFFTGDEQPAITKAELIAYINAPVNEGGLGGKLALTQVNKWLEGTQAEVKKDVSFTPVTSDTGAKSGDDDLRTVKDDEKVIKKSQLQFFEFLWSVATEEQKEQVKNMMVSAAREAVLAKAEAEALQAANDIDSMFPES
ncbi:hypothetical protein [Klebsiella variicola]|uniref:hypothetical protein n=1 Tax=Klebsiella variicola TaxID=244366 RepID=UPI0034DFB52B